MQQLDARLVMPARVPIPRQEPQVVGLCLADVVDDEVVPSELAAETQRPVERNDVLRLDVPGGLHVHQRRRTVPPPHKKVRRVVLDVALAPRHGPMDPHRLRGDCQDRRIPV